jgi:endonuclease-3 related protein
MKEHLIEIYDRLYTYFGPQNWWPGESSFEVIIGAVLTQNTNWNNVNKAIDNLKGAGFFSYEKISSLPVGLLAEYIRPAGYYNIKAARLHNLFSLIRENYDNDLDQMMEEETDNFRQALLSVNGIGPETADSILLYAAERPVF